jgi:hypothetical protein
MLVQRLGLISVIRISASYVVCDNSINFISSVYHLLRGSRVFSLFHTATDPELWVLAFTCTYFMSES